MTSKSIKWRQCPEITITVDWDIKQQITQTKKHLAITSGLSSLFKSMNNKMCHMQRYILFIETNFMYIVLCPELIVSLLS